MNHIYILTTKHSVAETLYLCQSSDWPAHGLICNTNESHSNLLHTHLWRAVVRLVGPICGNLWKNILALSSLHQSPTELLRTSEAQLNISVNISACDLLEDRKRLISWARRWKCFMVSSNDSGSFSPGPKIFGKKEGRRRPKAKLASVTVRGPPKKIPQGINFMFLNSCCSKYRLLLCKMHC